MLALNDLTTLNLAHLENDLRDAVGTMDSWEDPYVEIYKRGITGRPGDADRCVIAQYLAAQMDGAEVEATQTYSQAFAGFDPTPVIRFPRKVTEFIHDFDRGYYPELIFN